MSSKRLRVGDGRSFQTKRPIDKKLKSISITGAADQINTNIHTATFPGTLVGFRWSLTVHNTDAVFQQEGKWALFIAREGVPVDAISFGNNTTTMEPEANVVVIEDWYTTDMPDGQSVMQFSGSTKAMRKIQCGDNLVFCCKGESSADWEVRGTIQFFIKT